MAAILKVCHQNENQLSQERVKLQTSTFVRTLIGLIGTNAHQKFREK